MPVQYGKEGDKHVNIKTTMYIVVKYNKYLNIWTGWKKNIWWVVYSESVSVKTNRNLLDL